MGITYDEEVKPLYIFRYSNLTQTFSDNLSGKNNFDYFLDDAQIGDCIYFCLRRGWKLPWHNLKFNVGTSLIADNIEIIWEYSINGGWKNLPNIIDETNCFQNIGEKWVTWDVPKHPENEKWYSVTVNGKNGFWVRCRIVNLTNLVEGGSNNNTYVTCKNFAITITNFSEVTPCSLDDIYQADLNNGWGKFKKYNDIQYECDCNLVVGDWENSGKESWLIIKNKSLIVHGILQVIEYGNFQLGELLSVEDRRSRGGSHIHFTRKYCKSSFYSWYASPYNGSYSTIRNRVLSSLITGEAYAPYCYSYFFSSIRDGSTILPLKLAEDTITNRATLYSTGHSIDVRTGTYEDIFSHDSNRGIRLPNHFSAVVRNMKVRNCVYLFRDDSYPGGGTYLYLIDPDTDTWDIYFTNENVNTQLYRQYSFNLTILTESNLPIPNVKIELYNNNNELQFSVLTDSDGKILEQIVTSHLYEWESGSRPGIKKDINYNPFLLKITKKGFKPYFLTFNFENKVNWVIKLDKENIIPDQEVIE